MFATDAPLNLEELLDGIELPATKAEIIAYAEDKDAAEEALTALQGLPDDTYNTMTGINKALGMIDNLPGSENLWSSNPPAGTGRA